MQRGQIFQSHGAWFLRFYEGPRRATKRLASLREYPSKRSVEPLAQEILRVVNRSSDAGISLDDFIERVYLPHTKNLRASTHSRYTQMFRANIQGRGVLRVREYRTLDVQVLLDDIAASKPLARNTLAHIKHFLSGAFRYAAQAGVREGNPVRECHVPKQRQPAKETHAYDLQEIRTALQVLPTMQRAAVACAAFAGLRRSEVQGLEWSDYDGEDISVNRSVWRGHVEETKTKSSKNYVPAIQALRDILDEYRSTVSVVPIAGARLFKTNLEVMGRKSIKTAMESVGLKWYGWHAFRRGIASNLFELGCDDITVQRVLRHSRVQITQAAYIKIRSPKLDEAMQRLSDAVTRQQIGSK